MVIWKIYLWQSWDLRNAQFMRYFLLLHIFNITIHDKFYRQKKTENDNLKKIVNWVTYRPYTLSGNGSYSVKLYK